jgi:hypothetical protein
MFYDYPSFGSKNPSSVFDGLSNPLDGQITMVYVARNLREGIGRRSGRGYRANRRSLVMVGRIGAFQFSPDYALHTHNQPITNGPRIAHNENESP